MTHQLLLIHYDYLSPVQMTAICSELRRAYWFIRNYRGGKFTQAKLRKSYRNVAVLKRRLLLAGVEKRDLLDLLACCRLTCSSRKQPFSPCRYCS
jgi:hypothetical protein